MEIVELRQTASECVIDIIPLENCWIFAANSNVATL